MTLKVTNAMIKIVMELNPSGSNFFVSASACFVKEKKGNLSVQRK